MNGYALYGRDPVFADVDAHTDMLDAAEAFGEYVNSFVNNAVDHILCSAEAGMLLGDLASNNGAARDVALRVLYDAHTGEVNAETGDDWMRVMLMAEPEHLTAIRQQWLDWVRGQVAEYPEVVEHAARMARQQQENDAEDAALLRAGL